MLLLLLLPCYVTTLFCCLPALLLHPTPSVFCFAGRLTLLTDVYILLWYLRSVLLSLSYIPIYTLLLYICSASLPLSDFPTSSPMLTAICFSTGSTFPSILLTSVCSVIRCFSTFCFADYLTVLMAVYLSYSRRMRFRIPVRRSTRLLLPVFSDVFRLYGSPFLLFLLV